LDSSRNAKSNLKTFALDQNGDKEIVLVEWSKLFINPRFAQFESVFFGLFLRLESYSGGFDSFNFCCLLQVAIKNQSSWVPPILRYWNCHPINRMAFVSAHGQARRLFAIPVQRNDLTVLPHSFDRCPATLVRGSPIGGNIVGVGNPEELSQVSIQPPKLFHSTLDWIRIEEVGRVLGYLS
jgi:hypothetical protein